MVLGLTSVVVCVVGEAAEWAEETWLSKEEEMEPR